MYFVICLKSIYFFRKYYTHKYDTVFEGKNGRIRIEPQNYKKHTRRMPEKKYDYNNRVIKKENHY